MNNSNNKIKAKQIAVGGIFSATAIIILLAGGFIPIGTFAAPLFAGVCLIPLAIEMGTKTALIGYAAVSVLGGLLVPDHELVLFFILLFGYYPIIRPYLTRIKNPALRFVVKVLIFNSAVAVIYSILLFILASPVLREEFAAQATWLLVAMLILGNITFCVYDLMLTRINWIYHARIRKYFFK